MAEKNSSLKAELESYYRVYFYYGMLLSELIRASMIHDYNHLITFCDFTIFSLISNAKECYVIS